MGWGGGGGGGRCCILKKEVFTFSQIGATNRFKVHLLCSTHTKPKVFYNEVKVEGASGGH